MTGWNEYVTASSDLQLSVTGLREVEHKTAHHSEKTGLVISTITFFGRQTMQSVIHKGFRKKRQMIATF